MTLVRWQTFLLFAALMAAAIASAESVEDYARRNQGHFYQGFYAKRKKTGWFHIHRYIGSYQNKKMAISEGTRTLYERVQGKWIIRTLTYRRYYQLTGNGELKRAEYTYKQPDGTSRWLAVARQDGLHITKSGAGRPSSRLVELPHESLRSIQELEHWLATATPGSEKKAPECRIPDPEVNCDIQYRLLRWEASAQTGKTEKIAVLTMTTSRGPYEAWLHKNLVVLKLENSQHEIREETEIQAKSGLP